MSGAGRALEQLELFADAPVLALLRADNAPITLALLETHLGQDERSRTAAELYELLDADLDELRFHGQDLPRSAQQYCKTWVEQGYLTRRAAQQERTELFSLTESAHQAIRFLADLASPREAVTRSRLSLLTDRLLHLAQETDPDAGRRITALQEQQERIAQQIRTLQEHGASPLPISQAVEAAEELYALALDVPSDFARVRAEFERLHRSLRLELIEHDGPQGEILDQLFLGVDAVEDSEAGRSFAAFHSMLISPVLEQRYHAAADALATRDFASHLGAAKIRFLQNYLGRLQQESHQVRHAMIDLSRSLREFVRSRQFEQYRALGDVLRRPQRLSLELAPFVRPHHRIGVGLTLSTFTPRSVGQLRLLSPAEVTADDDLSAADAEPLDLEHLREVVRESEIDLAELTDAVDDVLAWRDTATIGEVLSVHPATQGLASIVGLLLLAQRHGEPVTDETADADEDPAPATERVAWDLPEAPGQRRSAVITALRFTRPISAAVPGLAKELT